MNANELRKTVESNNNLEQLACVGPVRSMRFARDTSIDTIEQMARASLDEIMQVWSVGPVISKRIKGSAQGWWNQIKTAKRDLIHFEREQRAGTKRVAIIGDQDFFEPLEEKKSIAVIENALDYADVELTDNTTIGFVSNDESGGDAVSRWLGRKWASGSRAKRKKFDTPWDKYAAYIDPVRFVSDEYKEKHDAWTLDEIPAGRLPEKVPLSQLHPDIVTPEDISWKYAAKERNEELVEWADEVVIAVEGDYTGFVRYHCEVVTNTPCTTVFDTDEEGEFQMWTRDSKPDTFTPDDPETVTGGRGVADGNDLGTDDHFRQEAFDTDEARLRGRRNDITQADPGGKGEGKNKHKW